MSRKKFNRIRRSFKEGHVTFFKERYGKKNLTRKQLEEEDPSLYVILKKQRLLDQLIPEKRTHKFNRNPLSFFRKQYEDRIISRGQLKKEYPGLYQALRITGQLIEAIPLREIHNAWRSMSNEVLIHYVRSWHYGDTLNDFIQSRDHRAYEECKKRMIKDKDGRVMSIRDFLIEEGTLRRIIEQSRWTLWENFEKGFKEVILELGHFPTGEELVKRGFGGLLNASYKYYGGLKKIRARMGYQDSEQDSLEEFARRYVSEY